MIDPTLIAITDVAHWGWEATRQCMRTLCSAARPGAVVIQLRDRELPVNQRYALGRELSRTARRFQQSLIVADRIDLAVLLGAAGVHLGEASVDAVDVRRAFRSRGLSCWISRAIHRVGAEVDADAVLLAPVFSSRKGLAPLGLQALEAHSRSVRKPPVYALGGVSAGRARACCLRGAHGVAAISAAYDSPERLLQQLSISR